MKTKTRSLACPTYDKNQILWLWLIATIILMFAAQTRGSH